MIFFLCPVLLFAQADLTENKDYVHTQKGSVFKGQIVEYKQGDYIRIRMHSGDTVQLQENKIKKIVQKGKSLYLFKERGYFYHLQGGIQGGLGLYEDFVLGLSFEHTFGYQYNRWLGGGLSIGAERYFDGRQLIFIPVSLNIRGYFLPQNRTPYYSLNVGYGFAGLLDKQQYKEASGGLMLNPSVGIRFGSQKGAFTLDFGLKMQNAVLTRNPIEPSSWGWWGPRWLKKVEKIRYIRTGIRFGWLF